MVAVWVMACDVSRRYTREGLRSSAMTTKPKPRTPRAARRSRRSCSVLHRVWCSGRRVVIQVLQGLGWLGQGLLCAGLTGGRVTLRWLWRLAGWLWYIVRWIGAWLLSQLLAPALCFGCAYAGVILTLLLPDSLWTVFALPVTANLIEISLPAFPLAELPDSANLEKALLAALPLAVVVFRHAYVEWQTLQEPLGARMLYACAAGVAWPKTWFRIRRSTQNMTP
jgi:hypothetical protein